ncbi:MAG TPA: DoxX family protein, partial [Rudaea sp.]|nr:DoxX family protein [Rudaea sp.]
ARSATWVLSIVLAIVFLATGIAKLTGASTFYIQAATMRGFPVWIRIVVGLVEIGGAIALLVPQAAVFGAVTLAILMFPAAATQHMSGQGGFWIPVIVFIMLCVVVWLRSPELIDTLVAYVERPHAVLRGGVMSGVIGATAVAVWFFIVDLIAGHPLFTPDTLGHALFSVTGPVGMHQRAAFIAAYTVFHYAAFIVAGILAASVADMAGEEPSVVLFGVLLFVAFEIWFYAFVAILQHSTPLGSLAWYQVLIGNVIAAVAMVWYLWRARPVLKEQFAHALDT